MSSTATKQPADENSAEPSSKKVKLDAIGEVAPGVDTSEVKDLTDKDDKAAVPSKNSNGNSKVEAVADDTAALTQQPLTGKSATDGQVLDEDDVDDLDEDSDDEEDESDGGHPDPQFSRNLEDISDIQNEISALNEKASEEILKVEQKFNELRKPHYEKRNELLRNIPQFWFHTLFNHRSIAPMIDSDEDEECLRYLIDLDVEEFEDIKSGYRIKLHFRKNPFFNNETIIKEFHMISGDEQIASSTPLEYNDSTDEGISLKEAVKKELDLLNSNKSLGHIPRSFFAWFLSPSKSGVDEIAEVIKDQIWPNPLDYYLSEEAVNVSDDEDDSDDEDELDEEEGEMMLEGEEICEDDIDEELIEDIDEEEAEEDEEDV